MGKGYSRRMTFNERMFVAGDMVFPPICNQLFLEGEGRLDYSLWSRAVRIASEANPGSRLVLKGHLGFSRWVDSGITPRIREVDGKGWDGLGPDGAPFLQETLPPREGPTCEVLLIHGDPLRIALRTHHGVMDARGTLAWAEDIFRALRGEDVLGSSSTLTDVELVKSFQTQTRKPFPPEHIAPTGRAIGLDEGVVWKRTRITGNFSRVLPQCARLAAEEAWRHADGIVRFGIPVDLRPRRKGLRSTANLSFALYIEVTKRTSIDDITNDLAFQLERGYEGMLSLGDELFRHVPLKLMASKARSIVAARHARGLYSLSGILSNLGRVDLQPFRGGGFEPRGFWAIPPRNEYHPFFLVMAGYEDSLELILSMPRVLAGGGRLNEVLGNMSRGITYIDSKGGRS